MDKQEEILLYVVDDDKGILKDLKKRLGIRDIKVECFLSARGVLNTLDNLSKDDFPIAILVDYVIKGEMGGKELVGELLKRHPQLPIIIISGIDVQGSIEAYAMGAYAVMQKPIDYNELEYTARELAKRNRQATQIAEDMLSITQFDSVLVWELDWQDYPNYKVTGSIGIGVNKDFIERARLSIENYPRLQRLAQGRYIYYRDVALEEDYKHHDDAKKRGWTSLLAFPFFLYGRMVGWIDCYRIKRYDFKNDSYNHKMGYLQSFTRLAGENLQAQRLREQFRIIHETSQNLSGTLQENLIYDSILTKALEITNADCGWIYRYEADEDRIILTAKAGDGAGEVPTIQLLQEKKGGISGKVAATGKSLYVPDVTQFIEDTYDPWREYIPTPGLVEKSILAVPLRRGERTLGVLTVNSRHPDFFIPDDIQFLTGLAAVAAVGMERQKLARHLEEVSRMAQTAIHFDDLAIYVVAAVKDLTDATVNLWMLSDQDKEGDEYLRLYHSTLSLEEKKNYGKVSVEPGSSYSADALQRGRHIVISDLNELSDEERKLFKNWNTQQKKHWRSFMVVPLIGKNNERLGVLSLLHTGINKFSNDDGTLIQHFANQAALALQEQRHLAILQELTQIGQELTTTLSDTKAYLKQVVELAQRISKASSVVIYPYDHKRKLFYAAEFNVWSGKMLHPKDKLTEKPRRNGLTALIRDQRSVRVEDISTLEPFRLYAGSINAQREYKPGYALYEETARFITGSGFIEREEIQSFIGVSLIAKEKAGKTEEVAVIYFNYRSPRYFTPEELQVIDIFCNQVANVIHRNRLFNALAEEQNLIEGVNAAALEILHERDQRKRLNKIVTEAVKLLSAKGGKVYLTINGGQQDLKLVAKKNLKEMKIGHELYNDHGKGKGIALEVVRSGQPRRISDYRNYENHIPELANVFSAVMEVPLLLKNKVIGVIGIFDDKDTRAFTEADERVLMQFAAQAALAVYNARLYDELEGLYKAGLGIAQNTSLTDMAKRILSGLQQVISFTRATIQRIDGLDGYREVIAYEGDEAQPGKEPELTRPPREDALILPIIKSRKPKIISNTLECKDWDSKLKATAHIRSWAAVPLVFDEKVLGLLILDHTTSGYYTDDDLPLLERFALQAAIGMNNALIEEGHLREIKAFSDIVQMENFTISSIVEEFSRKTNSIIKSSGRGNIFFKENEFLSEKDFSTHYNVKPFRDLEEEPMYLHNDELFLETSTCMFVPIKIKQLTIGIIQIFYQNPPNKKDISSIYILLTIMEKGMKDIAEKEIKKTALYSGYNPYSAGPIVKSPDDFFGRSTIISNIINKLSKNHFIVFGERRIGKSSLLHQLKHHLETKNDDKHRFIPIYLDYEATQEHELWLHTIDYIQSLEGKVRYSHKDNYEFEDFRKDLDTALERLFQLESSKDVILVLLMDEIDVFNEFTEATVRKMRKILQEESRVRAIMAGVEIKELADDAASPWYNMFMKVHLDALPKDEARMLITQPVIQVYSFSEHAITKIIDLSKCKPFEIQKLCAAAVDNMLHRVGSSPDTNILNIGIAILESDVPDQLQK